MRIRDMQNRPQYYMTSEYSSYDSEIIAFLFQIYQYMSYSIFKLVLEYNLDTLILMNYNLLCEIRSSHDYLLIEKRIYVD